MDNLALLHIKIADIITSEYEDFKTYCEIAGKFYFDEITPVDYIAYRSQFGRSKTEVKQLRAIIEAGELLHSESNNIFKNDVVYESSDVEVSNNAEDDVPQAEQAFEPQLSSDESDSSREVLMGTLTEETVSFQEDETLASSTEISFRETSSETTYAEIYHINIEDCKQINIVDDFYAMFDISFSVRVINGLTSVNCRTLKDLLLLTPTQLSKVKNLGTKSIKEIEQSIETVAAKISSNELSGSSQEYQASVNEKIRVFIVKPIVKAILNNQPYSADELSNAEKLYLWDIQSTIKELGIELCQEFLDDAKCEYLKTIIPMLNNFHISVERTKEITTSARSIMCKWHASLLNKKLRPFLQLFCMSQKYKKLDDSLQPLVSSNLNVDQYADYIQYNLDLRTSNVIQAKTQLAEFQEWMSDICVDVLFHKIFDANEGKNKRLFDILYARVSGATLEDVGKYFGGLTRERVRQIERKAWQMVRHRFCHAKYNLLGLLSAFRNGDCILQKEELYEVISKEDAELLWYCATRTENKGETYLLDTACSHYDSAHDVIVIAMGSDSAKPRVVLTTMIAREIAEQLPDLIKTTELQAKVTEAAVQRDISPELCMITVSEYYREAGIFSYKRRLTIIQICDYILKYRFQNGYKIADETDSQQFLKYIEDMFGKSDRTTARAVDAKIMDIGVLIDRGKYVYKDYISVDQSIVDEIFAYIEENPKSAITYTEIFAALSDIFAGTVITNRYVLQGVMKLYNSPYESHRDYITKDSGGNVADELTMFVKSNGEVHKSEILEEFPGWKDYNLSFVLPRCPEVISIDNGYFIHSDTLTIDAGVKAKIYQYMLTHIQDIPVSTRYLQDEFMFRFPEFMIENDIQSHGKLFGILQYMFAKEFHFSRPYIAKENIGEITNKSVLLQHLEEMQSIEISDFIDLCSQNSIHYVSVPYLIDMMQPEFVRVDEITLMRSEDIGIREDIFQDVTDLITEAVLAHNGYIAAKAITDFSWYPELNVEWTPFLLESIANMIPTGISTVKIVSSSSEIPHSIFVSEEYVEDDWNSLLVKILKKEHSIEPFRTKTAVLEWLKSEGLCNINYPAFLDTEHHVYFDDEGKLMIE